MERLIVIDTNVLITFFAPAQTELEDGKFERVLQLFQQIETNKVRAIIPEVVLHETFYTLLGRRFPNTHLKNLCQGVSRLLVWPGWYFQPGDLEIYLRALEILEADPKLEFSDSVIAARAEAHDAELATFDRRLAKAYGGPVWADS